MEELHPGQQGPCFTRICPAFNDVLGRQITSRCCRKALGVEGVSYPVVYTLMIVTLIPLIDNRSAHTERCLTVKSPAQVRVHPH